MEEFKLTTTQQEALKRLELESQQADETEKFYKIEEQKMESRRKEVRELQLKLEMLNTTKGNTVEKAEYLRIQLQTLEKEKLDIERQISEKSSKANEESETINVLQSKISAATIEKENRVMHLQKLSTDIEQLKQTKETINNQLQLLNQKKTIEEENNKQKLNEQLLALRADVNALKAQSKEVNHKLQITTESSQNFQTEIKKTERRKITITQRH